MTISFSPCRSWVIARLACVANALHPSPTERRHNSRGGCDFRLWERFVPVSTPVRFGPRNCGYDGISNSSGCGNVESNRCGASGVTVEDIRLVKRHMAIGRTFPSNPLKVTNMGNAGAQIKSKVKITVREERLRAVIGIIQSQNIHNVLRT